MIESKPIQPDITGFFLKLREAIQSAGQAIALLIPFIIIYNGYAALSTMDPYYRITLPALCFIFALVTTSFNLRLGLMGCIFALPLIPHLAVQIQGFLGYARVAHLHNPGLELIAGLYCGAIIHHLLRRQSSAFNLPWQAGLLMVFLTFSVVLSIAKNLHQSTSDFHLTSLLYNLTHIRTIDWHDDYRPLIDWIAYGAAFTLLAVFVPVLKTTPDRNHIVFKPLIWGIIIAAIVGYWQSKIGIGLTKDQLMFRADVLGYMAIGFQPDNHAFAGHMLLGTIGILGYLYYTENKYYRVGIIALVIPISWTSLLLSKSRSSFALSIVFLVILLTIWIFRHSRFLSNTLFWVFGLCVVIIFSVFLFKNEWLFLITLFAEKLGFSSLAALNLALVYRPEIFSAAIKIFSLFPLVGLGQGEFYRQASNYDLTQSYYLSLEQNGENAHNYFLQTLAETGLIGFSLFTLVILYPICRINNKKKIIPALIALCAVFIGNLYSHSMLVRENLFLATVFIALMYAWQLSDDTKQSKYNKNLLPVCSKKIQFLLVLLTIVLLFFAAKESYQAFKQFPFTTDTQCFKNKSEYKDGWSTGILEISLPRDVVGIRFKVLDMQPETIKAPLTATLSILNKDDLAIATKEISLNRSVSNILEISLPEDLKNSLITDYRVNVKLNHCFIPRNLGNSEDGRRLGIKHGEIDYLHR